MWRCCPWLQRLAGPAARATRSAVSRACAQFGWTKTFEGAVLASFKMKLGQATRVIPLGIAMGLMVLGMNTIRNVWIAAPFLVLLGGLGGFLVVPMNALLQHRGAVLMGGGRSIAVQNFNEQACILALGGGYALLTGLGLSAYEALTGFGTLVALMMWWIKRWHDSNLALYPQEMQKLLEQTSLHEQTED